MRRSTMRMFRCSTLVPAYGGYGVSAEPVGAASSHPPVSSGNGGVEGLAVRSPYLLVEHVAARYHCSVRRIHELTRTAAIPHLRHAGTRRCLFREDWLDAWDGGAQLEVRELAGGGRIVRVK
jgi:hypothetical protein